MAEPSRAEEQLEQVRRVLEQRVDRLEQTRMERDVLIVALILEEGRTYQEVAEIAGLSLPGVAKIAKAAGIRRKAVQR